MKRRELERRLRIAGCYLKREGSSHALWINPKTGVMATVPWHNDIKESLAKQNLEEFERGLIAEQQVTADDVLTRLAPEQSISRLQTFLAMKLPITTEWNVYEQACHLAVDINHHLFDTLYHAVALQSSNTLFITADTQCFRKAAKRGHIIELKDFAPLQS